MSEKITVAPDEVWGYYVDNQEALETKMHLIAENPDYGIEIYITDEEGLPQIIVNADDVQIFEASAWDEIDFERQVQEIYDDYLTDKFIEKILDSDSVEEEEEEDYDPDTYTDEELQAMIDDREADLEWAMSNFLDTVLEGSDAEFEFRKEEFLNDCLEHFIEYIARKHDVEIYRPMWIEYEDGAVECEDYPYDKLEFDDEDNPIYAR